MWLHEHLESLPLVIYPFLLDSLPKDGIYFFYETGEYWGHGRPKPRVVRVGTSKDGNFRSRIKEHFLLDEKRMNYDRSRPAPHDRSILRKNIGRALLNLEHDPYLDVWEIDFTTPAKREQLGYRRDIAKEKAIEAEITRLLRENFSFRFVLFERQAERMGSSGLESALIGTLSHCGECCRSPGWLGCNSPVEKIRDSGLWLVQHLAVPPMDVNQKKTLAAAVSRTEDWIQQRQFVE
jgi:hypothetical protein